MSAAPSQELDSFIDEKKAAPLPFVEPPGYQATPGVDSPPPPHGEPEQRRCCRRRCRRFGHFFLAAFFLWLGARFLLRHCELRRFGPHHWVLVCSPSRRPLAWPADVAPLSSLRVTTLSLASMTDTRTAHITPTTISMPVWMPVIGPSTNPMKGITIMINLMRGAGQSSLFRAPRTTYSCSRRGSMHGECCILPRLPIERILGLM